MISVLCPTRGRPLLAEQSINSLAETAAHRNEALLRFDDDDFQADRYEGFTTINVWYVFGPRYGYKQLHRYYNGLAKRANGDWLLLWNDDARMLTPGWDEQFDALDPSRPLVATPAGVDHPFPAVSRVFYQALGHFSPVPHCDTWVCEVAKAAGCMAAVDYEVKHLRDSLDDETKREGEKAQREVTLPLMQTDATRALLERDIEKVRAAMAVTA